MEERIKQIMADILGIDPNGIDEATAMDNTESWDSANHLNLCFALEQEFNVTFEIQEIESMLTYYDILQVLHAKL